MTTILTTLTTQWVVEPLEGIGTVPQSGTAIPQHVLIAQVNQTVPTPGAGNNQEMLWAETLPDGFAYLLTDFSFYIELATLTAAQHWSAVAALETFHYPTSGPEVNEYLACNSWGTLTKGSANFGRIYMLERKPLYPLNSDGTSNNWRLQLYNTTAADPAVSVIAMARFLAFDAQQYNAWPLHTPQISLG